VSEIHQDKGNIGPSILVALGSYQTGGVLNFHETCQPDAPTTHSFEVKNTMVMFQGTTPHSSTPYEGGDRFSLVFFTHPHRFWDSTESDLVELGFRPPKHRLKSFKSAAAEEKPSDEAAAADEDPSGPSDPSDEDPLDPDEDPFIDSEPPNEEEKDSEPDDVLIVRIPRRQAEMMLDTDLDDGEWDRIKDFILNYMLDGEASFWEDVRGFYKNIVLYEAEVAGMQVVVNIKAPTGQTFPFTVRQGDSVMSLKTMIEDMLGIPPQQFYLLFNEEPLTDLYELFDGCVVKLMMGISGGGPKKPPKKDQAGTKKDPKAIERARKLAIMEIEEGAKSFVPTTWTRRSMTCATRSIVSPPPRGRRRCPAFWSTSCRSAQ
jgi:hypothetical protein